MLTLTPPGLYDVSVAPLPLLKAMFERHERERIPAIVYEEAVLRQPPVEGEAIAVPPRLVLARLHPDEAPPAMRRWFMGAPFVIAIPEAVWHACPAHLLDFGDDGRTIVVRHNWDGPAVELPAVG